MFYEKIPFFLLFRTIILKTVQTLVNIKGVRSKAIGDITDELHKITHRSSNSTVERNSHTYVLLKNARESGRHEYIPAADIGREMGTYENKKIAKSPGRIHRKILDKLEDEHRVESRNESGRRTGWRLTDAEWNRLTVPE